MFTLSRALWTDETGFIISSELVLIATVGVIGMTAALSCVRDSVVGELNDVAGAFGNLNQSYCYTGFSAASPRCCKSRTVGSCFTDHQEDVSISRADFQTGPHLVRPLAPPAICEPEIIEERVIKERIIESSDEAVCPEQPHAAVPETVGAFETPVVSGTFAEASGTCQTCRTTAEEACSCSEPRPIHAARTRCGELLHYSETTGQVVRLIDEVDAIHRPHITPSLSLW